MKGERTGKTYQLGDKICISVAAVSLDERKIDFVPKNEQKLSSSKAKQKQKPTAQSKPSAKITTEEKKQPKKKRKNRRRRWMN